MDERRFETRGRRRNTHTGPKFDPWQILVDSTKGKPQTVVRHGRTIVVKEGVQDPHDVRPRKGNVKP